MTLEIPSSPVVLQFCDSFSGPNEVRVYLGHLGTLPWAKEELEPKLSSIRSVA